MSLPALCPPAAALAQAIADCRPDLHASACKMVGSHDADDLVQATIERALSHQASFQPNSNLMAWMRRIMSNMVVDGWRHQNRYPRCPLDVHAHAAPLPEAPEAWEGLSGGDLRAAIGQLRPSFRQVFELYLRGLPYQDIAARLGIPIGTVGTRLLRGRTQLRVLLGKTLEQRAGGAVVESPVVQLPLAQRARRRTVWTGRDPGALAGAA